MTSTTGIPLCIAIGLVGAFGCGWSCRGIEESTTFRECPPVRVTLDVPPCTEARDASAITCAMAIGAAVDAMQREAAIDDWAEERADDSVDAQLPREEWERLP